MSNNQRGTVFLQLIQRRLNGTLRLGIQRRGGFIKDQDRAVTQQRAGNSNTLALAAGQHHAILADDGIQTIIHLVDEIHGVGHARGLFNLLAAVLFGTGIGDIVGDGIVEQMHVLRNQRHLVAQRAQLVLAQVVAIQQDLPLVDIVEAGDQAGNGRFTRP